MEGPTQHNPDVVTGTLLADSFLAPDQLETNEQSVDQLRNPTPLTGTAVPADDDYSVHFDSDAEEEFFVTANAEPLDIHPDNFAFTTDDNDDGDEATQHIPTTDAHASQELGAGARARTRARLPRR